MKRTIALVAALMASSSCSGPTGREAPNVLFVMIDTLRADRCTPYGYRDDTTPYLADLAGRGALFQKAYAPMPITSASTATAFTSRAPRAHGVLNNRIGLRKDDLVVAEILRDAGYQTAGFVSSAVLNTRWGFAQGFESYLDRWGKGEEAKPPAWGIGPKDFPASRRGSYTTADTLRWFAENRDPARNFFVFVHYFDPHEPYVRPAEELAPLELGRAPHELRRDLHVAYEAEVAYADRELRKLIEGLDRGGELENTLIVVWADHGQGLFDHGWPGHGRQLYDEALRVPFVLVWPGVVPEGRVIEAPVELADLVPTVLGLIDLEIPDAPFEGRDLTRALLEREPLDPDHAIYFERAHGMPPRVDFGIPRLGPMRAVQAAGWKYIEAPEEDRRELYDLTTDPHERRDLSGEHPEIASELQARLAAWVAAGRSQPDVEPPEVSPEEDAALKSLGYVD